MTTVGTTVGRYELLRLLAAGGMGEVYLARLTSEVEGFGALAAVKVLPRNLSANATFVKMFLDEARAVGRLHHKNIVQVRDVAEHLGQYYIVMEYISGQNLRELLGDASIRDRPLFEPRLGCDVFIEIASALAAAHAEKLIHRDVSPNNIMISDEGIAKLIDFGVARALGSTSGTNPGTLKGKFGYMAPEYVREQAYDHRADIFSLGVVMWETFARRRLFRGTAAAEQLHQLLEADIPRLDEVLDDFPADLATMVAGALERDPTRRISSANMLAEALTEIARGLPVGPDLTLRKWLERRIPGRLEERRRVDNALLALPRGAAIPDFGVAFPDAGSLPGTYGFELSQPIRLGELLGEPSSSSGGAPAMAAPLPSAQMASQMPTMLGVGMTPKDTTPPPISQLSPKPQAQSSRGKWVALIGGLAVAAVVIILVARGGSSSPDLATKASGSDVQTAAADEAPKPGSDASIIEAHRQIGLKAMSDGDYAKARSEFQQAIEAGGGGDLAQLASMAEELQKDSTVAHAADDNATDDKTTGDKATDDKATDDKVPTKVAAVEPPKVAVAKAPPRPTPTPRRRVVVPQKHRTRVAVRQPTRREAEPTPAAVEPVTLPPTPEPPKKTYLAVTSSKVAPAGTVMRVDGKVVGPVPGLTKVKPGNHKLVIENGSRILYAKTVDVGAGETQQVKLADAVFAKPAEPAKPPPAVVRAQRPQPKPTPRVSSDGSVDAGRRVVGACSGCHRTSGISGVAPRSRSRAMWERFFASGQHDRYIPIGDRMSAGQLRAARAYLRANAADSAENQGAGIKN